MKNVTGVYTAPRPHWVGDGFPVRSMFSYQTHGQQLSPFLLLDYAGPYTFPAGSEKRGVGEHPHRGFETVTIVYAGEVEHRDSTGRGGVIGPGDVQWMTAGAGILHEEFHSAEFAQSGGLFEMAQLWVNLPAKDKMTAPKYQAIAAQDIPAVQFENDAGQMRIIAGEYAGRHGPASTFSPVNVWDGVLKAGHAELIQVPADHTVLVTVLEGEMLLNGGQRVLDSSIVMFAKDGEAAIQLQAVRGAKFLVLTGKALDEPIQGYGPFVMNSKAEIAQAVSDFNSGKFGRMG